MKKIVIIDGQGGGFGRALIDKLCQQRPADCRIIAVGTNAMATAAMIKAGADVGATGENPVVVNSATADIIAGPMGIVLADSMLGEFTPKMAAAVAKSNAQRVLIPVTKCSTFVAGVAEKPLAQYIEDAAALIRTIAVR
ncbi:MAG: DUF3842 family protein [Angelakisella sp.]